MGKSDNSPSVILVVDDCVDSREMLRVALSLSGYIVVEASDGQDAVEMATRVCPDLILMDLSMPRLDGYGALLLLREVNETRNVPVIACSSDNTAQHRDRAFAVGFNEYLLKPVDFTLLESLVCRFLNSALISP